MIHTYEEPQTQLVEDLELYNNFGSADDSARYNPIGKAGAATLKKKRLRALGGR